MDVGDLQARLKLDTADFKKSMDLAKAEAKRSAKEIADAFAGAARVMSKTTSGLKSIMSSAFKLNPVNAYFSHLNKQFKIARAQAAHMRKEMVNITRGIVLAQAFYRSVDAIRKATRAVGEFAMQAENAEKSFAIMLRSEEHATALVDHLKSFAAATQFSFETASAAAKQLLAYGFKLQDMDRMMNALGDASAAMGDSEAFGRIAKALGQIRTKGKLATQELLQLTEVGIPAFEILEEQLGLTKDQLGNIAKSGIDASTAIEALMSGIEQRYGGAMEALADTVEGYLNNIKETFTALMAEITSPFYESMKRMLKSLSEALGKMQVIVAKSGIGGLINEMFSPEVQKIIRQLVQAFQIFGASVKNLMVSLSPFIQEFLRIASVVSGVVIPALSLLMNLMSSLLQIVSANTTLMNAFRVAVAGLLIVKTISSLITGLAVAFRMLTSPVMLVVAGLTAVIALFANLAGQGSKVTSVINGIGQAINNLYGMNSDDVLPPDLVDPPDFGDITGGLEDTEEGLENAGDAADKAAKNLMSFDEVFNLAEKDTAGGLGDIEMPEVDMSNPLGGFGMEFDTSGAEDSFNNIGGYVQRLVNKIKKAFDDNGGVFETFRVAINKVADDLIAGTKSMIAYLKEQFGPSWDDFWDGTEIILVSLIDGIRTILLGIIDVIEGVCRMVEGIVKGDWETAWAGFYQTVDGLEGVFIGLVDIAEGLLLGLIKWLDGLFGPAWDGVFRAAEGIVEGFAQALVGIIEGIGEIFVGLVEILGGIMQGDWTLVFSGLEKVADGLRIGIDGIVEGIKTILGGLTEFLISVFGPNSEGFFRGLETTLVGCIDGIGRALDGIILILEGVLQFVLGVFAGDWDMVWQGISNTITGFGEVFQGGFDIIHSLLDGLLSFLNGIFGPSFDSIFTFIGDVVDSVMGGISRQFDAILQVFSGVLEFLLGVFTGDWDRAWSGVKNIFGGCMEFVFGGIDMVLGSLKAFIDWVVRDLVKLWNTAWSGIESFFSGTVSAIKGYIDGVKTWLQGIIDFVMGVFTGNWERAWEGVKNIFKGIFDSLVGIVKTPINFIIDLINGCIDGLNILIKGANHLPGLNIPDIPHIPALATGGIVQKHTLAEIGEGNKKEAVIPLERGNSTGMIADKILQGMPQQPQQPQPASEQSSSGQEPATVLYVGTLIADDRSLKELERRMKVVRLEEEERG